MTSEFVRPVWERLRAALVTRVETFDGVAGFCIRDLTDGTSIAHRGDEGFPAASTIKIHILTALLKKAEAGELDLEQRIALTPGLRVPGSGVLSYLEHPVELSLFDIAVLMILVSDNTATNICIERVGMDAVNALIRDLNLKGTHLRRLMQDRAAILLGQENLSTPADLVSTVAALYAGKPTPTVAQRTLDVMAKSKPTPFRLAIPADVRLSHKTGRMARVRNEAGIVHLERRPYAIAVMTRFDLGDDAEQDAFVSDLARITHQYMALLATTNEFGQGRPT